MTSNQVPTLSIVGYGIGLLVLVAVIIAAVILLRNHVKNWAYPAFVGVVFYLIFSFVIPEAIVFVATLIPGVKDWAFVQPYQEIASVEYATPFKLIYVGARIVTDFFAIFLGVKYFLKNAPKQQIYPHIGHILALSATFFVMMVLIGDVTTRFYHAFSDPGAGGAVKNFYQGIYIGNMINNTGFDEVIKTFVEQTAQGEEVSALELQELTEFSTLNFMTYVKTDIWTTLCETLEMIAQGIAYVSAAVFAYAVCSKKSAANRILETIAMLVLMWAPYMVQAYVEIPVYATAIYYAVLAAVAVLNVIWLLKHDMPGEWGFMSYSRKDEKKKYEA